MLLLVVNLAHANPITTFIVDQDQTVLALPTDISEDIADAAWNVNVTLSFVKVVMIVALEA